jgi:hypothetical protein
VCFRAKFNKPPIKNMAFISTMMLILFFLNAQKDARGLIASLVGLETKKS